MPIITRPSEVRYFSGKLTDYLQTLAIKGITGPEYDHIKQILTHFIDYHGMGGNAYKRQHDHNAVIHQLHAAVGESRARELRDVFEHIISNIENEIHSTLVHVRAKDWTEEEPVAQAPQKKGKLQALKGMFMLNKPPLPATPPRISPWEAHNTNGHGSNQQWSQTDDAQISEPATRRFGETDAQYKDRLYTYLHSLIVKTRMNDILDDKTAFTASEFIHAIKTQALEPYLSMHTHGLMIRIKDKDIGERLIERTIQAHDSGGGRLLPVTCLLLQIHISEDELRRFDQLDDDRRPTGSLHDEIKVTAPDTKAIFQNKLYDFLNPEISATAFDSKHNERLSTFTKRLLKNSAYKTHDVLINMNFIFTSDPDIIRKLKTLRVYPVEDGGAYLVMHAYRVVKRGADSASERRRAAGHLEWHANVLRGKYMSGYYEKRNRSEILQRLAYWMNNADDAFQTHFKEDDALFQKWITEQQDRFEIDLKMPAIWIKQADDANAIHQDEHLKPAFHRNANGFVYITPRDTSLWQQRFPAPAPPATGKKATDKVADLRTRLLALRAMREQSARDLVHRSDSLRPAPGDAWHSSAHGRRMQAEPSGTLLRGSGPPPGAPPAAAGQPPRRDAGQPPSLIAPHQADHAHFQEMHRALSEYWGAHDQRLQSLRELIDRSRPAAMPPPPPSAHGGPPHPRAEERAQWPHEGRTPAASYVSMRGADGSLYRNWGLPSGPGASHDSAPPREHSWPAAAGSVRAGGAEQTYVLVPDGGASAVPAGYRGGPPAGAVAASWAGGGPQGHMQRAGGGGSLGRAAAGDIRAAPAGYRRGIAAGAPGATSWASGGPPESMPRADMGRSLGREAAGDRGGQPAEGWHPAHSWGAASGQGARMIDSAQGGSFDRTAAAAGAIRAGGAPGLPASRTSIASTEGFPQNPTSFIGSRRSSMSPEDADAVYEEVWGEYQAREAQILHAGSLGRAGEASPHAAGPAALRSPSVGSLRGRSPGRETHERSDPPRRSPAPSPAGHSLQVAAATAMRTSPAASLTRATSHSQIQPPRSSVAARGGLRYEVPDKRAILEYWHRNIPQITQNISEMYSRLQTDQSTAAIDEKAATLASMAAHDNITKEATQLRNHCSDLIQNDQDAQNWIDDFIRAVPMNATFLHSLLIMETVEKFIKDHTLENAALRSV
jgi:hypothetical protein